MHNICMYVSLYVPCACVCVWGGAYVCACVHVRLCMCALCVCAWKVKQIDEQVYVQEENEIGKRETHEPLDREQSKAESGCIGKNPRVERKKEKVWTNKEKLFEKQNNRKKNNNKRTK